MQQVGYFELVGFGPNGWGGVLLLAAVMTLAVSVAGFAIGAALGAGVAWAKISGNMIVRVVADAYTTVLRGIPDILVIYLFYFGGSAAIIGIARMFGSEGFIGVPTFLAGSLAIGVVSAAYQAEVFRGAFRSISTGEIEAAKSMGMPQMLVFRRIIVPQILRFAIPGMGNIWQLVLKESALISVIGLVELLRQATIAAGSTRRPFDFYLTAAAIYLLITWVSNVMFRRAERYSRRGLSRAAQ